MTFSFSALKERCHELEWAFVPVAVKICSVLYSIGSFFSKIEHYSSSKSDNITAKCILRITLFYSSF